MAFNPSTTIFLCNVDFDNTYKNVRYFKNRGAQLEFFMEKVVKRFEQYTIVREKLPDGANISRVRVGCNIEELRSLPCNYLIYQNRNHGTRFFYAFITEFVYIKEDVTEIRFETDVFQTWFLDCEIMPSYVVREHSVTDEIGENVVPEECKSQDFDYIQVNSNFADFSEVLPYLKRDMYVITASHELGVDSSIPGKVLHNMFQGLYFYHATTQVELGNIINNLMTEGGDCIVSITCIPEFCLKGLTYNISTGLISVKDGYSQSDLAQGYISIDMSEAPSTFGLYKPKNNKLRTHPYETLIVSNHNGEQAEYRIEDFPNRKSVSFDVLGSLSTNPSITMIPINYQGIEQNYDAGISLSDFPQCSFNCDTYKLWLAKNQFGMVTDSLVDLGMIMGGIAAIGSTGGAGAALGGGGLILSGSQGLLNTFKTVQSAKKEPNRAQGGGAKSTLRTAAGFNTFSFFIRRIKENAARTIDDYFTMYGYQTNRVKVPNISSRNYFNYVQTIDVNIIGGIPSDDLSTLKSIFDKGVTLWKSNCTVGDYSVNNSLNSEVIV